MSRRRGISDIRTLGHRRQSGQDQRALLRASVIEAELHRLDQERRLLEQRLDTIKMRSTTLLAERNQLLGNLEVRHSTDRSPPVSGFQLRY